MISFYLKNNKEVLYMVMHKNQHYVPEFYLSMFSSDLSSINVFNIENNDSYKKGIKHICAESYFWLMASLPRAKAWIYLDFIKLDFRIA